MEANSPVKLLEAQIRECFGRVVWTHKTQEKCADLLLRRNTQIKLIQIGLSAITTTGVLIAVFGENKTIGIVTAIFSAILFGINSYVKGHDLGEIAQKHTEAASELWDIREKYLSLLTDLNANLLSVDQVIAIRDELQEKLAALYKGCPRTITRAYNEATLALKLNEELTLSDAEIDLFLPKDLRKNKM